MIQPLWIQPTCQVFSFSGHQWSSQSSSSSSAVAAPGYSFRSRIETSYINRREESIQKKQVISLKSISENLFFGPCIFEKKQSLKFPSNSTQGKILENKKHMRCVCDAIWLTDWKKPTPPPSRRCRWCRPNFTFCQRSISSYTYTWHDSFNLCVNSKNSAPLEKQLKQAFHRCVVCAFTTAATLGGLVVLYDVAVGDRRSRHRRPRPSSDGFNLFSSMAISHPPPCCGCLK